MACIAAVRDDHPDNGNTTFVRVGRLNSHKNQGRAAARAHQTVCIDGCSRSAHIDVVIA
jgi:hypothetical protein